MKCAGRHAGFQQGACCNCAFYLMIYIHESKIETLSKIWNTDVTTLLRRVRARTSSSAASQDARLYRRGRRRARFRPGALFFRLPVAPFFRTCRISPLRTPTEEKSPPLLPRLRLPHAARARHCFSTVSCFHAFLAGLPGERGARHCRLRAVWRLRPTHAQ